MKRLTLGVFQRMGSGSMTSGTWAHPANTAVDYTSLDYWTSLARLLEDGGMDFLFIADGYGLPLVNGELSDATLRDGKFFGGDSLLLISALASSTRDLGLVATSPTTFELPYATARRFSTLDHLSAGRVGWNVVTSAAAESASALFGRELMPHNRRYDMADEFLSLAFELWEGAWGDDALPKDREARIYARGDRLQYHDFQGEFFQSKGIFAVEPSPQRTPVLFQAGTSDRGREFAGRNAECTFLQGSTVPAVAEAVADIRRHARAAGRDEHDVRALVGVTVVTGSTPERAAAKHAEMLSYASDDAAIAEFARLTGVLLSDFAEEQPLPESVTTEQGQSNLDRYRSKPGKPAPTVREILNDFKRRGTRGLVLVGTPDEVVEQMVEYVAATDIDGFLLEPYLVPDTYVEFIEEIVPRMRAKGLIAPEVRSGLTLRQRLFGDDSPRINERHRAAAHRLNVSDLASA